MNTNCLSWIPTGTSLIAEHPHLARSPMVNKEFVAFSLIYTNTFLRSNNEVMFKFRASQKQNGKDLNGLFQFKIDG